jgi:hypothetical protein
MLKEAYYLMKYIHVREKERERESERACSRACVYGCMYDVLYSCIDACVYECSYLFLQPVGRRKHKNSVLYFLNSPQHSRPYPLKYVSVCDHDPAERFCKSMVRVK